MDRALNDPDRASATCLSDGAPGRLLARETLVAGWLVVYFLLGLMARRYPQTGGAGSHFIYVPIVLATAWWGRKAVLPATLLGGGLTLVQAMSHGMGGVWAGLQQAVTFLAVAVCVAWLSDRLVGAERALRAAEERYRLLIEKSLTGILVYRDDRIIFLSPRFGTMLGHRPEDVIGRSIWNYICEQDRAYVEQLIARRKDEGVSDLRYECRFLRADGTAMWADVASNVALFDGEPAVMVNAYDITDRKAAEQRHRELSELTIEQEEQLVHSTRLAELGEMAAAVAHELNQPLTGIKNYARNALYMIETGAGDSQEVTGNIQLISDQVDRATRIINQMRQLTRRTEPHFGLVAINPIVRDSVEFVLPQFRLSGVEVSMALAEDLPEVLGDRIRLEQVFLNLLTNARQAMEETSRRQLWVRTYFQSEAPCPLVIEVEDTGKGFAHDEVDRIFTPFYSTKKAGHGTGLGLSISLTIVKEHKGEIEAAGTPGKGATFRVRLPVLQAQTRMEATITDG
jgi:PAS domain S-box-containing protein